MAAKNKSDNKRIAIKQIAMPRGRIMFKGH